MNLESKRPSGPLFRVGRDRDAWAIPDWAYAKEDGTFGNRFDDPMRVYRVLYPHRNALDTSLKPSRFKVTVAISVKIPVDSITSWFSSDSTLAGKVSKGESYFKR